MATLAFDWRDHLVQPTRLADRYADFQVYRRNKREAIPLVCPP
jgi:hypothetical protein